MKVNGKNINKVRKALESSIKEGKIFKDAKKTDETPEELQLEENKRTNDKLDKLIELTEQNVELQEESILGNIGMCKS